MSYQTGTATDCDDLMSKLDTFLTGTPGWTQELYNGTNRRAVYSKAGVSRLVQFQWDNASGYIGLAMIGAYVGDVVWTSQTACEFTSSTTVNCRHVTQLSGPFPSYHFFEDDNYFHVVVEISSGLYRHFGFGQALLLGDLGGGAYIYGHYWSQSTSYIDNPTNVTQHWALLDGNTATNQTRGSGFHCTGMSNLYDPNTKYFRQYNSYTLTDDDGDYIGTFAPGSWRGGPMVDFMATAQSDLNNFKPLQPIPFFVRNVQPNPDIMILAGYPPDIRYINLEGLTVGQEITVGSDTWIVFPITRKYYTSDTSYNQEQSYNWGVAYKKVTT